MVLPRRRGQVPPIVQQRLRDHAVSRRDLLRASAVPFVPEIPEELPARGSQRSGVPPWHMWGNTQTLRATQTAGSGLASPPSPGQMVRIGYKRPESWHWVLSATILEAPEAALAGSDVQIDVLWNLTIGIGRAAMVLPRWEAFRWFWNNPNPAPIGPAFRLITTSSVGNRLQDFSGVTHTTGLSTVDQLVAQDVQLDAQVILTTSGNGFSCVVECSALWSPKTHIRPEWYEHRFPGGEEQ